MQSTPTYNPMDWMAAHWAQLIGWSAVATFMYRFYTWLRKLVSFGEGIESTRDDTRLIMTNHLPHIQAELEKVNENISGLREDLKTEIGRLSDDIRLVLTRMP